MSQFDIPKSWNVISFGDLNQHKSSIVQPDKYSDTVFELYSVPVFFEGKPEVLTGKEIGSSKQYVESNDILVCKINPRINRVWIVGNKSEHDQIASSEWIVMRSDIVNSGYLLRYFQSEQFRAPLCADVTGVGGSLTRAQPKKVATFPIPLAPLAEQQVIANKLDSLLAQVESIKARLERIPEILKEFRQSVLAAAVSGKLTDLESSWEKKKLKDCFDCIDGDRGPNYPKKDDYLNEGYCLFLSTKNVREFGFDFKELVFISREKDLQLRKGKLERGDIVITTRGTLGYVASYDDSVPFDEIRINSGMLILRKKNKEFVNDFFKILIASPAFQRMISLRQTGSAQPQLPAGILKDFDLAFPCVEEQVKIVNKVKVIFTSIDLMEQQVQSALNRVNNLTQSILAKAFRGELTAEWRKANPELISGENSAEALLKRIKAERESAKSATKRGRGKA